MQGVKKRSEFLNGVICKEGCALSIFVSTLHPGCSVSSYGQIPENSKLPPKKRNRVGGEGGGGEIRTLRGLGFSPCGVRKNTSAPRTKAPLFKRLPSCTSTKYILGSVSTPPPSPGANHTATNSSEAPRDWALGGTVVVTISPSPPARACAAAARFPQRLPEPRCREEGGLRG